MSITWTEGIVRKKAPGATQAHIFDWTEWLAGDTISSATVSGDTGITVAQALSGDNVTALVSGGTKGKDYNIRCKITTAAALIEQRSIIIRVVET